MHRLAALVLLVLAAPRPALAQATVASTAATAPRDEAPAPAAARASATKAVAVRAEAAPLIDGRDDDAVWREAMVIDDFRGFEPFQDAQPTYRTLAKVAYDARNIYVFVRAFDAHPDSIVGLLSRRDQYTHSDWIHIGIDSYHDRRTAYHFMVNPAGVQSDSYIYNDGDSEDDSWNAVWDAATRVDSLGWTAEFRIPLSQLRYAPGASTFGLMVLRDIARYNERDSWPFVDKKKPGLPSQFGELGGLGGLGTARRLEVVPYVVTRNVTQHLDQGGYGRAQLGTAGADVKYGLTSNLTVDATVNPDFGQVEADPSVLNLSAFETFYQEKRPFFLEGMGVFRFDLNCNDGDCSGLFYSRRIGRQPQLAADVADALKVPDHAGNDSITVHPPEATTILGAAKLTGRLPSGTSVGVLDAVTREETVRGPAGELTAEPRTNYFVGRVQQDFNRGESGLGAMVTAVDRSLDPFTMRYLHHDAYAAGIDFRHRMLSHRYEVTGYAAASQVAGSAEAIARTQLNSAHYYQRRGAGLSFDSTRTGLSGATAQLGFAKVGGARTIFSTSYQLVTPGFEINDVGYLQRADQQGQSNWLQLRWDEPTRFYRKLRVNFNQWNSWTTRGLHLESGGNVNTHVELPNSWSLHFGVNSTLPFPIYCDRCARGGPAVRQSGNQNVWGGFEADERMAAQPALFFSAWRGDEGRSAGFNVEPNVNFRVASRFSMSVGPSFSHDVNDTQYYDTYGDPLQDSTHYTFARLDQKTLSITTRVNVTFTPALSLQLYAQPFISSGEYTNLRELDDPRAASYDARYKRYLVRDAKGAWVQPTPDSFNYKELRSTSVLRWEYRPGSTIYLVWQQGRSQDGVDPGSFRLRRDIGNLFAAHPDNTLLIKASFWAGL